MIYNVDPFHLFTVAVITAVVAVIWVMVCNR